MFFLNKFTQLTDIHYFKIIFIFAITAFRIEYRQYQKGSIVCGKVV